MNSNKKIRLSVTAAVLVVLAVVIIIVISKVRPDKSNKDVYPVLDNEVESTGEAAVSDHIIVHVFWENGSPSIYCWNLGNGIAKPMEWPGTDMAEEENGWYGYTINDAEFASLIFNYDGKQTEDLKREQGEWWYKDNTWYDSNPDGTGNESLPADPGCIKLHFKTPWSGAKLYYWNVNIRPAPVEWPGTAMESEGDNWYSYMIDAVKANLIFNCDGVQTEDLSREAGEWWYKDGVWYDSKPETSSDNHNTDDNMYSDDEECPERIEFEGMGIIDENETCDTDVIEDFRNETIYFVITTRFYDGNSSNNVHCWDDDIAGNDDDDPAWRGDFKGLIEKLDYIKALGFTAIWISPVVVNTSGYDYHGYHASDFSKVDPRYESEDATYQDLINEAHARGMKVIQDIVLNHTGNFGEANLMPMFEKSGDLGSTDCLSVIAGCGLPDNYDSLSGSSQYQSRLALMKNTDNVNHDKFNFYHHYRNFNWDEYNSQLAQIAGDCVDLNTENPVVYNYLIDAYTQYIKMGVDGFRIDTAKHISRLTFNEVFNDAFHEAGGEDFFMFGEVCARDRNVWYRNTPPLSCPFYTWKDSKDYPWSDTDQAVNVELTEQNYNDNLSVSSQPVSSNAFLEGNDYHTPDYNMFSGLNVIDFPMHWNFESALSAFNVAVSGDKYYNDATWNVVYVDSHDYAPDCAPEGQRYSKSQDTWAENLNLMFTFRGIPCIYYGSEVEFMKGAVIDAGNTAPLDTTGRAYFGDLIEGDINVTGFAEYSDVTGTMADTLNYPLSLHIQRLNKIRAAIPALRMGQYSTEGVSGSIAFKRRYTDEENGIDSFVCVSITGSAVFTGIPDGHYVDAITGDEKTVTGGTLRIEASGKGNMRVYVLDTELTKAPGKIGTDGKYLK